TFIGLSRGGERNTPHDMVATVLTGDSSMLSAIISTRNSERSLVPTLSALVPAAAAGLLAEVVIADASSHDATADVADIAGCRFTSSTEALGLRLKAAAATVRSPWVMFLRAGAVPQPGWIEAADHFIQTTGLLEDAGRAAIFRPPGLTNAVRPGFAELLAVVRAAIARGPRPEQGLLIARRLYDAIGGHSAGDDAEAAILRRLGRQRLVVLPASITIPNI
ncbi:MAG: glycosyltransferase, partial [Pseudolabrys sp.]